MQAVTRKWKSLKLRRNDEMNKILGMVWAMALVPPERFSEAISTIEKEFNTNVGTDDYNFALFIHYLRHYWLRIAPQVSTWGCPVRTNNIAEGFNRQLPTKLRGARPPMYRFLSRLCFSFSLYVLY